MTSDSKYPIPAGPFINPSVLSADFADLKGELAKIERAGCRWAHLDVMDGHFVPNLTIGPVVVQSMRRANKTLFFDTHLMIEEPLTYAGAFVEAGSDLITIHAETCDLDSCLRALRRHKTRVGVSVKPKTPLSSIEPFLKRLDLVLIMSVEPGFGGQSLIEHTLEKVRQLALWKRERRLSYVIEIDGGVNAETAPMVAAAGAEALVAGSAVFKDGKVGANIRRLRKAIGASPDGR